MIGSLRPVRSGKISYPLKPDNLSAIIGMFCQAGPREDAQHAEALMDRSVDEHMVCGWSQFEVWTCYCVRASLLCVVFDDALEVWIVNERHVGGEHHELAGAVLILQKEGGGVGQGDA
eukprot:353674-Chlamydomonas_euryale.AAC.1